MDLFSFVHYFHFIVLYSFTMLRVGFFTLDLGKVKEPQKMVPLWAWFMKANKKGAKSIQYTCIIHASAWTCGCTSTQKPCSLNQISWSYPFFLHIVQFFLAMHAKHPNNSCVFCIYGIHKSTFFLNCKNYFKIVTPGSQAIKFACAQLWVIKTQIHNAVVGSVGSVRKCIYH